MSKRIIIFLFILASPFLTMVIFNECFDTPKRTHRYVKEYCTWYCHDVTCLHWKSSYKGEPTEIKKMHKDIFDWYINSLHGNPLKINYGAINLLVFLVGYPFIGGLLVWNLIKNIR